MWKHVIYLGGAVASAVSVAISGLVIKSSGTIWREHFTMILGDKPLPKITSLFLDHGDWILRLMALLALFIIVGHVIILQKMKGSPNRDFAWGTLCNVSFVFAIFAMVCLLVSLLMPALSITTTINNVAP